MAVETQNQYFYCLIDPSFQGVNRRIILPFENVADRTWYTGYNTTKADIEDYNVMIE